MPEMANLAKGRTYDFSRIEYDLTTPHMRRAQRFPGQRARFVHMHNIQRALGSGITEESLRNGQFFMIATFKGENFKQFNDLRRKTKEYVAKRIIKTLRLG